MKVLLIRHAKAGDRDRWTKPDEIRPLTAPGKEQAEALVTQLADFVIERVISSGYARCVQTVEPLAAARGLEVETDEALAEGASLEATLGLIANLHGPAALCTHGDVLGNVIDAVPGADPSLGKKASTWVLDVDEGHVKGGVYLEPPA